MTACILDEASLNEERQIQMLLANHQANKPTFDSYQYCEDCDIEIPAARRAFAKGITRCVDCQNIVDIKKKGVIRK